MCVSFEEHRYEQASRQLSVQPDERFSASYSSAWSTGHLVIRLVHVFLARPGPQSRFLDVLKDNLGWQTGLMFRWLSHAVLAALKDWRLASKHAQQ
jgi:hypothetical protein